MNAMVYPAPTDVPDLQLWYTPRVSGLPSKILQANHPRALSDFMLE